VSSYLLDSNVAIDFLAGVQDVKNFYNEIKEKGDLIYFSAITVAETLTGDEATKKRLFNSGVIAVDKEIAMKAAELRSERKVKTPDALIIATALINDLILVTRDSQMMGITRATGGHIHEL
jgi:tRNA(fMet)-specific endonuclease VapC